MSFFSRFISLGIKKYRMYSNKQLSIFPAPKFKQEQNVELTSSI